MIEGSRGVLVGARAPGKLVLVGEYAVLFGAPAIVTAVDRYAEARFTDDPSERPRSTEAARATSRVEAEHGRLGRGLATDVTSLRTGTMKLGLGSSAAAAVASAAAALHLHGIEPAAGELFSLADAAHREVQPGGSGVDVAASAYGGTVRFSRSGEAARIERIVLPSALHVRVVFTGREASTTKMLGAMRRFEAQHSARFDDAQALLAAEAERAASARTAEAFVEAAGRYGEALDVFGGRVGIPIVEADSRAIDELALQHHGRAKPSGAGGGDVAVAFFASADDAARFDRAARRASLEILALGVEAEGPSPVYSRAET
jgi:phosphomevalonate kinase